MVKQIPFDVGFSYCKWYSESIEINESIAYSLAHLWANKQINKNSFIYIEQAKLGLH